MRYSAESRFLAVYCNGLERGIKAGLAVTDALLELQITYFTDSSSDLAFQKYRHALTKSGVVKNQSTDVGKLFVCHVNINGARRCRIGGDVHQHADLTS